LGMRVAGRLAVIMGMWSEKEERRQNELLSKFGIPETLKECGVKIDAEKAWDAIAGDKKAEKQTRVYVLPLGIGRVVKTSAPVKKQVFEALAAV